MGSFTRDNTELAVDIDGAGQQHIDDDTEFVEFTRADRTPGINSVAL